MKSVVERPVLRRTSSRTSPSLNQWIGVDAGVASLGKRSLANTARAWAKYLADNHCTGSELRHSVPGRNGENIYWISGWPKEGLASRADTALMNSPHHKDNILRTTFHHVGIGIAHSSSGWYVVQNFANW